MKDSETVQAVINTLEVMSIPATYDNVNKLTGIYQVLYEVRDKLAAKEKEAETEGADDAGNDSAEKRV